MRDQLISQSDPQAPHQLGWSPRWDFCTTVERTVAWYRQVQEGACSALEMCKADLVSYEENSTT